MKRIRTPKLMVYNKNRFFVFFPDGTVYEKSNNSMTNATEEFKYMQTILKLKITELDIEKVILQRLIYNKIYIISDLVSLKKEDLMKIEGINEIVFDKIYESVIKKGLSLGMNTKHYITYYIN